MKRLRLILLFALLIWLPLALATAPAASAEPLRDFGAAATTEIREMLQEIPAIRVHMVSAPGNGHQSANLRVIQRLRELGYGGRIQVVYESGLESKLGYLVPGFDEKSTALQKVMSSQLGPVEFVSEKEAAAALGERMKLTISGARDRFTDPHHRRTMNSDYFVQLQPKRWTIRGGERAIYVDGVNEPHALGHLRNFGPLTLPLRDSSLAEKIERAKSVPEKGEGLAKLLAASNEFDWMPAYSIDFTKDPEAVMENIVKGLRKAAAAPAFDRPIVVPILTPMHPMEWETKSFREAMEKLKSPVSDIADPKLAARLAKAKPGEVVLVQVGRLPPEVFDDVISRATLPVVLEGKNLTQQAMERGLPFLNVTGSLKDIEPELLAAEADKKAGATIRSAFQALDEKIYGNTPERTANSLAKYFREAKDGSVAEFFSKLKVDPASVEQDLTGRALLELKDVMAKTPPVASARPVRPPVDCAPLYRNLTRGPAMSRDGMMRPRPGGRFNRREF